LKTGKKKKTDSKQNEQELVFVPHILGGIIVKKAATFIAELDPYGI